MHTPIAAYFTLLGLVALLVVRFTACYKAFVTYRED